MGWRKNSILLLVLIVLLGNLSVAQDNNFDEHTWRELTEDLDYGDVKEAPKKDEDDPVLPDFSSREGSGWSLGRTGQVIVISLIVLVLIFLVARLLGFGAGGTRIRAKKEHQFSIESLEENLHESDLDRYLRLALDNEDYRVALRIYYLSVMKNLSELGWIIWKKDKTNYDYVREMRPQESHQKFRDLTGAFEIIWYGEIDVHRNEYDQLHPIFKEYVDYLESKSVKE